MTVDLYNHAYGKYELPVYHEIREETYGHDLGQTSWVSRDESEEIAGALKLDARSYVLEIGCGSGRYALKIVEDVGCRIVGVDLNESGIRNAELLAAASGLNGKASFRLCDVSKGIAFADAAFDAAFSNDVLCHIPGRLAVLREMARVLRPGARLLFSDALVIGGLISHDEVAARSSVGYYVFSPPGENERLLEEAGFRLLNATDTTENAARIAQRWHDARAKRREALIAAENNSNFEGLQRFLSTVYSLARERRLLRYVYLAQKLSL
jgi:ubiquinone/menaquinone biosynthesis C-methylase UbiE